MKAQRILLAAMLVGSCGAAARASDHDDTPLLKTMPRHDARITDLYAFVRGENLVLAVCLDPTIPATAASYAFAADLTVTINVDSRRRVSFNDAADLAEYGGTILDPARIRPDVAFEVTFDALGQAQLTTQGLAPPFAGQVQFFAGLRDDPFIRAPRTGRNIAALVVELPLAGVSHGGKRPLLIWATSTVADLMGPFHDVGGRALRSQFIENDALNTNTPAEHAMKLGVAPDVIILDPTAPVAFPNGRELTDDVVDLAPDPRVTGTDAPFPTANDLPFLADFPYLAAPHPAP